MDEKLLENTPNQSSSRKRNSTATNNTSSKIKKSVNSNKKHANEKEEAFDAFHNMLNSCTDESSFNVSDAATLLRQMTPSVISSVLQLVSQKIASESQRSSPTDETSARKDGTNTTDPDGDSEIMLIVSQSNSKTNDKKTMSSIGSNSCSPISAAVQALMSFNTTSESYLKLSMAANQSTSHSSSKETNVDQGNEQCTLPTAAMDDSQSSDRSNNTSDDQAKNDVVLIKEEPQKSNLNQTLFTPITSTEQSHTNVSMTPTQFASELLLPNLNSLMNPLSLPYPITQSTLSNPILSSSIATISSMSSSIQQKQIAPRPILPKPSDTLLSNSLASILQKGGLPNAGNFLTNPILPPEISPFNQVGIQSTTVTTQARGSTCAPVTSANTILIPKYCTPSSQVLHMPVDALDLQQLIIRAQLYKPNDADAAPPSASMCDFRDVEMNKLSSDNTPSTSIVNVVALKPENVTNSGNLEVAASALLSIGGSGKDKKLNNQQVVAAFNRQKATYDLKETTDDSKNDVLFTSSGTFQIEDVEIDPRKNKIEKDNYECGKCHRVFTSIIYLARHIKRVCPDMSHRKWKCDRCEKAFRHPFGLQQHVYTHTGERPFKCEQCSKAFYSANDLRRHKRTHSGERPYQCSHCAKTFSTTISLKTHTFIHTGERPHKCPACPKTFATSSKLSRHFVTHSDQRPFCCDLCPKTFNRSGDLRRHYNNIHGQEHKLIECNECNKVFATQQCLTTHRLTHNRDLVSSATKAVHVGIV